jgi:putative PIN family toxin of toxin-antitoxin system
MDKLTSFIGLLREYATLVPDPRSSPKRSRDPDDDYLLAVCKAGRADVLLTGDGDLLVLKHHEGTAILSVAEFRHSHMK